MTNKNNEQNAVSCGIVRDLLPSYADGLTSAVTSGIIEEHLSTCASCRKYLEQVLSEPLTEERANEDLSRSDDAELDFLRKEYERNRNNLVISIFSAFGLIAFVSILVIVAYILTYLIRPDCGNLVTKLNAQTVNGVSSNNETTVCDQTDIGRFRYILCQRGRQFFLATLRSNLIGRFKIQSVTELNEDFHIKIVGTDTLRYLIFFGKNEDLAIKQADVSFYETTYSFDVSDKPLFLMQTQIDPSIGENPYAHLGDLAPENVYEATPVYRFLDKDGNNITSSYFDLPEGKYTIRADLSNFPECAAHWRIDWDMGSKGQDTADIPLPDVEICASLRFKNFLLYLVRFVPEQDGTDLNDSYWEPYKDKIYYVQMGQRIDGSYTILNHANVQAYPDMINYDVNMIEDRDCNWLIYFSSGRPDWSKTIRFVLKRTGNEYTVPDDSTSNICLGVIKIGKDDRFSDEYIREFLP